MTIADLSRAERRTVRGSHMRVKLDDFVGKLAHRSFAFGAPRHSITTFGQTLATTRTEPFVHPVKLMGCRRFDPLNVRRAESSFEISRQLHSTRRADKAPVVTARKNCSAPRTMKSTWIYILHCGEPLS